MKLFRAIRRSELEILKNMFYKDEINKYELRFNRKTLYTNMRYLSIYLSIYIYIYDLKLEHIFPNTYRRNNESIYPSFLQVDLVVLRQEPMTQLAGW